MSAAQRAITSQHTGPLPESPGEVLVTIWSDGMVQVAQRPEPQLSWSRKSTLAVAS